ncbi:peptide transporter family 1 [Fopius arisanus]|uniref:Oligopeptide transporter 1 n=1 Tax=Fopius arisanus TaxID=64838 RepID=A0A0C9QQB9_9HYME|nr:PREDICTED: peptide transporter family 1-like [Fopius arisanus]
MTMVLEVNKEEQKKKLKYPKAIIFIVCMEFCERFSYYGMRTILSLYLKNKLHFSDDSSTVIYHIFMMFIYFFPLFGAILADSMLGRFKTIFYLSLVYALGQLILAAGAVPPLGLPTREITMTGLFFIAVGTGGIKPCVSALGGDQFILPEQDKYLVTFFSIFCFTLNAGALLSSFLAPELRNNIACFGDQECYSIAFAAPAILMIAAIAIFLVGRPLYIIKKPTGNIIVDVAKCMWHAICQKWNSKQPIKRKHWLDYADDQYNPKLISDIKMALRTLKVFLAFPMFWALVEQLGSRWTFQATRMDGEIGSFLLKADQMQMANPLFIMIFIPLMEAVIYPIMTKLKFIDKPLQRITTGGVLGAIAFIFSGLVELKLTTTYPVLPTNGYAQLRIFNPRDCHMSILMNNQSILMEPFALWEDHNVKITGNQSIPYFANFSECGGTEEANGFITAVEKQATSYVIEPSFPYVYKDHINKSESGNPAIRVLSYNTLQPDAVTEVELSGTHHVFQTKRTKFHATQITPLKEFSPGKYSIKVNGKDAGRIDIKIGGVYTLQTYVTLDSVKISLVTVTPSNSVHILWLLPQYITIALAEVMFCVTGLEFAFKQAPSSMKSFLQASWLFTVAFGNVIVVIIAEAKFFEQQVSEFFFFAGLTALDFLLFAMLTRSYKYHNSTDYDEPPTSDEKNIPLVSLEKQQEQLKNSPVDEETAQLWEFTHEIAY